MLLPGFFHPDHVIEQQFVTIARGQTAQTEIGSMHKNFSQLANFGIDTRVRLLSSHRIFQCGLNLDDI
jgi:hypothetical protein